MLAAGSTGAKDVDAHVVGVDLHGHVVLYFRGDLDQGEGSVPAVRGIERAEPDQAVHSTLTLEPPVGALAGDPHRRRLQSRLLAHRLLDEVDAETTPLGPAQEHA